METGTAAAFGAASDSELEADVPMAASGSASRLLSTDGDYLTLMMALLTQLIQSMPANIAAAVKKDEKTSSHLDNVKLDVRNFSRIKTCTNKNKHDAWKEWKNQFHYVIQECDHSFADFLSGMEKKVDPIDTLEDFNRTQSSYRRPCSIDFSR